MLTVEVHRIEPGAGIVADRPTASTSTSPELSASEERKGNLGSRKGVIAELEHLAVLPGSFCPSPVELVSVRLLQRFSSKCKCFFKKGQRVQVLGGDSAPCARPGTSGDLTAQPGAGFCHRSCSLELL